MAPETCWSGSRLAGEDMGHTETNPVCFIRKHAVKDNMRAVWPSEMRMTL
jgi:hypothetical protein